MKTIARLSMIFTALLFFGACEKIFQAPERDPGGPPWVADENLSETITQPFMTTFNGSVKPFNPGLTNGSKGYTQLIEEATGTGTYFGKSTFTSVFTLDQEKIKPSFSYFIAENGDVLYVSYQGKICNGWCGNDCHPSTEICCWGVEFTIIGGTGRFEGATGQGKTSDYVDYVYDIGCNYHHTWKGEITLLRKNQ
jgi:hypothetical protein